MYLCYIAVTFAGIVVGDKILLDTIFTLIIASIGIFLNVINIDVIFT